MAELKKIGYKDRFYSRLQEDYDEHGKDSFIYRYMKAEKEKKTGEVSGSRQDSYVCLREYYRKLQTGEITQRDYLLAFLKIVISNGKIHLEADQNAKQKLLEYGRKIGGEKVFEGERSNKQKYEKMYSLLEAAGDTDDIRMDPEDLAQLQEELLSRLLKLDIQTFLYDVGYPLNRKMDHEYKSRKKDRTMDMLDAYCEENHIYFGNQKTSESTQRVNGLSEKQMTFCMEKYRELKADEENDSIVLPVLIDSFTGAGIYIMGKSYFPDAVWKARGRRESYQDSCCFACFYWNDVMKNESVIDKRTYEDGVAFYWFKDDEEWSGSHYPNLQEALSWYYTDLKKNAEDFFSGFNQADLWEDYKKGMLQEESGRKTPVLKEITREDIERAKKSFHENM